MEFHSFPGLSTVFNVFLDGLRILCEGLQYMKNRNREVESSEPRPLNTQQLHQLRQLATGMPFTHGNPECNWRSRSAQHMAAKPPEVHAPVAAAIVTVPAADCEDRVRTKRANAYTPRIGTSRQGMSIPRMNHTRCSTEICCSDVRDLHGGCHAHMAVLNASDGGRNLQHMAAELYEVDVSLAPSIVKVPAVDCDQCTT